MNITVKWGTENRKEHMWNISYACSVRVHRYLVMPTHVKPSNSADAVGYVQLRLCLRLQLLGSYVVLAVIKIVNWKLHRSKNQRNSQHTCFMFDPSRDTAGESPWSLFDRRSVRSLWLNTVWIKATYDLRIVSDEINYISKLALESGSVRVWR
jgi:hypothetical protein